MRGVALLSLCTSACLLTTSLDGLTSDDDGAVDGGAVDARDEDVVAVPTDAAVDADDGGLVVTALRLFDTDKQTVAEGFESLPQMATYDRATLPVHFTVEAVTRPSIVGSVVFLLDGDEVEIENIAPYDIAGSTSAGVPKAWEPPAGTHTITAIPRSLVDAGGTSGASRFVTLTINR